VQSSGGIGNNKREVPELSGYSFSYCAVSIFYFRQYQDEATIATGMKQSQLSVIRYGELPYLWY
jgi:hypothetical protein